LRRVILLTALLFLWSHQGIHIGRNVQADINIGTLGNFAPRAAARTSDSSWRHELEAGRAVQGR
jgi:hypothetical protein